MQISNFLSEKSFGRIRIIAGFIAFILLINIYPIHLNSEKAGETNFQNYYDFSDPEDSKNSRSEIRSGDSVDSDVWPTFQGGVSHLGNSSSISPDDNGILWASDTKGPVFSPPTINNNNVYFGDGQGYVNCLNIDTGALVWQHHTSKYSYQGGGGEVRTALTINSGNLYFGCVDWNVYAVNETNGDKVWHFNTTGEVTSTPIVSGGKVFVGSSKGFTDANGTFYALNEQNGEEIWHFNSSESITSTPTVSNNYVYVGSEDYKLYCLNTQTGAEVWNFTTGGTVKSSPTVNSGVVYFGSADKKIYALDAVTGAKKWERTLNGAISSSGAIGYDYIFITTTDYDGNTDEGGVYMIDLNSGAIIDSEKIGFSDCSPAIAENRLFLYSGEDYVHAFSIDVNSGTITLEWERQIPQVTLHSSPAVASGRIFIGADLGSTGKMIAFGTPDFKMDIGDVVISEIEPFIGEYISLKTVVTNRGSVAGSANVTFSYASASSSVGGDIDTIKIELPAREAVPVSTEWQVTENPIPDENLWVIWFNITDVEPYEENSDNYLTKTLNYHIRDLSKWQMFHSNFEHTGYADGGAKSDRVIWQNSTSTPSAIQGSIIIGGNKLYAATMAGKVQRFDEKTGQPEDEYSAAGSILGEPALLLGDDTSIYDKIITATKDGKVNCFDLTSTSLLWSYDTGTQIFSSPILYNGIVYIGAADGHLYALDEDGHKDSDQGISDGTPSSSDGDLIWKTDLGSAVGFSTCAVSTSLDILYLGTLSGKFYAVDTYSGKINWTYTSGAPIQSTPTILNDLVIVGSNDTKLYAFDARGFYNGDDGSIDSDTSKSKGDLIWITDLDAKVGRSSAAGNTGDELIYIGTTNGKFHAVEASSGTINWSYDSGANNVGSPVVGDTAVYFNVESGNIFALDKTMDLKTSSAKLLWNFSSPMKAKMIGTPAISGNRLYCADSAGWVYALGKQNQPPVAVIKGPVNGSMYTYRQNITFDASDSYDPDDKVLYYIWSIRRLDQSFETNIYSGYEPVFTTNIEKGGDYIIKLTVTDSLGAIDTAIVNITNFGPKGPTTTQLRLVKYCEETIPACCFIQVGGPGQVVMSVTSNPGSDYDLNLSVNKFVSYTYADIPGQGFIIDWTNISIGFVRASVMHEMNISRIGMYYWDSGWNKLPDSGVAYPDSESVEVWANFTGLIGTTPVIFAPGTFDNTPPQLEVPIETAMISPTAGREIDDFTFTVLYRDYDSDPVTNGGWVQVYIDDKPYLMDTTGGDYATYVTFELMIPGIEIGKGAHTVRFAAHDGTIRTLEFLEADVALNISASAPTANAGSDFTVEIGEQFTLDATDSSDPDGDIDYFYWDLDATEDKDGDGDFTNDKDLEGITVNHRFGEEGKFIITLTVVDTTGASDTDTIVITVTKTDGDENGKESDLERAAAALGIGIIIIILAIIVGFLFIMMKSREDREMAMLYEHERPVKKHTVKKIKRRRLGEEAEEEEEIEEEYDEVDDERVSLEESEGMVEEEEEFEESEEEYEEEEEEYKEDEMEEDEEYEDEGYDEEEESEGTETTTCPQCGKELSSDDYSCPDCGYDFDEFLSDDEESE